MDVVWLTYDELAERLGIERESARQHVKRKRWARRKGNDAKVRIGVPEEALKAKLEHGTEGGTDPIHEPGRVPVQSQGHDPDVTEVLTRHIERLEGQLEDALKRAADRDEIAVQRDALTAQLDALRTVLEIERSRVEEWKAVANRFATQVDQLTAAVATRRSWWPFRRKA